METPAISIRFVVANNENAGWISRICEQAFREIYKDAVPEQQLREYINEHFNIRHIVNESNNKVNEGLFAFTGDRPVGYMKLSTGKRPAAFAGSRALEIRSLYVLKGEWEQAAINALLDRCLQIAGSRKYAVVWTSVWEADQAAAGHFAAHGFREFDRAAAPLGDRDYTYILMKRAPEAGSAL